MALKAIIDALESVDEGVRNLYRKVDAAGDPLAGKFVLDVEAVDGYVLAPVEGLKTALSSERALREKAETTLKAFEGVDPAEVRRMQADHARLSTLDPEYHADLIAAEKAETAIADIRLDAAARAAAAKQRENRLTDQIRQLLVTSVATQALTKHGGNVKLLLPHVESRVRITETETGQFVPEILNDQGVARIKDVSGALMSIEDLIVEMRGSPDFGVLFANSGSSGSGAQNGNGGKGATGDNPWRKETWNVTKQMQLMIQDTALADRLRREAGMQRVVQNPWRREEWNVTAQHRLTRTNPAEADRLKREALQ